MWGTSLSPSLPCFPRIPKLNKSRPLTRFPIVVSPNSPPLRPAGSGEAATPSSPEPKNPSPNQKKGNQKQEITGSAVLWALQRAAAEKKKAKKKRKESSSANDVSRTEKDRVDYSNVRPLRIKSEWGARLDELEKRLKELQQENI